WQVRSTWLNLMENPATVRWVRRVLGTILALAAVAAFLRRWRTTDGLTSMRLSAVFAGLVLVQYGLGVLTLLHSVPVALGASYQATAVLIFIIWVHDVHSCGSRVETSMP